MSLFLSFCVSNLRGVDILKQSGLAAKKSGSATHGVPFSVLATQGKSFIELQHYLYVSFAAERKVKLAGTLPLSEIET